MGTVQGVVKQIAMSPIGDIVAVAQAWGLYKDKQNEALSAKNTQSALTGYGEAIQQTIEAGRKTFVEVGLALAEIRDSRLYRSDFDTFEAYCQKKWNWKRDYCDKLIQGANVVKLLPEKLHTIVGTETQARELAKVEPSKRVEVLEKALPEKVFTIVNTETQARELAKVEPAKRVEVLEKALPLGTIVPTESQARELAKVEPAKRLIALEQTIEAGRKTFVEVGLALAEIRDSRLYRSDHATFEEYCNAKWGWNRAHCNQLIAGAAAVKSLPPEMDTVVSNQRQARELAKVEPSKRVEVLEKAAEAGPVTAKTIQEAAAIVAPRPDNKPLRQDPFRLTVDAVKEQVAQIIRHRPAKKNQLLTCSKVLAQAAKKLAAFAKKAKD